MRRLTPLLLALACVPFACSTVETPDDEDGGSKKNKKKGEEVEPTYIGVPGITVRQVAIYQSLKRTLMVDGGPGAGEVPLVAGRDAVVRVFYEDDGTYDGSEITARLEVEGGDPIETTAVLGGASVDEDIDSTINFVVPGNRIGQSFNYSVGLLQEGDEEDENSAARWPAEGLESVPVEGPQNKLRVILAPFQYNYDGSGRVPDMSPETVEGYRQRLKAIYPVSDVEVSVRQVTPWNQYIGPGGEGWQQVGYTVYGFRQQDGTPDDVYYYGIFSPGSSIYDYCGGGCLLGVTLLNDQPPATGSVDLRLAMGVGFPEYAADTMAHELGHAHGRKHAPCGGPDSVDPQYPYAGAKIGIWGLDTVSMQLIPPTVYTDIMGYCDKQWVSDYTYKALLARGQNVNLPSIHGVSRVPAAMVGIDGKGHATYAGESTAPINLGGRAVKATFIDGNGHRTEATARYFEYDHLPGGLALVPGLSADAVKIEIEVDGVRQTVSR